MLTQHQFNFWRNTLQPHEFWSLFEGEAILAGYAYTRLENRPHPIQRETPVQRPISHGRTELSMRREAAQIAQRRMWGEY